VFRTERLLTSGGNVFRTAFRFALHVYAALLFTACGGGGGGSVGSPNALAPAPQGAPAGASSAAPAPAGSSATPAAGGASATPSGTASGAPVDVSVVQGPFAAETPGVAAAFVDTAGVNVHLSAYGTLYGDNSALVQTLLVGLGVHHVRDGAVPGQNNICQIDRALAANGIRVNVIVSVTQSWADISAWLSCIGPAAETLEGPNEYDLSGDPNWVARLTSFQQGLFAQFGTSLPVLGPAMTSESAYGALSLARAANFGNVHAYFAGRNPGTPGWGGTDAFGEYGSLAYDLTIARQTTGSAQIIATETGYSDSSDTYAIPPATKADYTLRTLLEDWNAGVPRTYFYELIDEGVTPFSHYGLIDGAGNPKPAYTALRNFLRLLSDTATAFTPTPLAYQMSAAASVHHVLLQKQNGVYQLILWVEAPEWDPNANAPVAVAAQTVAIKLGKKPSNLSISTFDSFGNISAGTGTSWPSISQRVTGSPTILTITP
jgi:hypothetical protein